MDISPSSPLLPITHSEQVEQVNHLWKKLFRRHIIDTYELKIPKRKAFYDALEDTKKVFIRYVEPNSRTIWGDYFKLSRLKQPVVLYLGFRDQHVRFELKNLDILSFFCSENLKNDLDLINFLKEDDSRWNMTCKQYASYWKQTHTLFELDFTRGIRNIAWVCIREMDIQSLYLK